MMLWNLVTFSGNLMEWIINVSFFSALHPRKYAVKTSLLLGALFTAMQFLSNYLFLGNSALVVPISIAISFCFSLLYRSKWYWKILESLLLFAVMAISEIILGAFSVLVLRADISYSQTNIAIFTVCTWSSKIISYLLVKLLYIPKLRKNTSAPLAVILQIISLPLATVTVSAFAMQAIYLSKGISVIILTLLSMALLFLANVVTFRIIERENEFIRTKEALRYAETHIRNQISHYKELYDYQTELRKSRHDLKNKLLALSGLLHSGETEQAKALVEKELAGIESAAGAVMDSGDPVIDAVLQAKRDVAKAKNITLIARVQLTEPIGIDALELGVLIGNAADNAIEAAEKLRQDKPPEIVVQVQSLQGRIRICVENPTLEESGNVDALQSAKSDTKNHGYGLQSIRSIADRHDGTVSVTWQDHRFTIAIGLANRAVV